MSSENVPIQIQLLNRWNLSDRHFLRKASSHDKITCNGTSQVPCTISDVALSSHRVNRVPYRRLLFPQIMRTTNPVTWVTAAVIRPLLLHVPLAVSEHQEGSCCCALFLYYGISLRSQAWKYSHFTLLAVNPWIILLASRAFLHYYKGTIQRHMNLHPIIGLKAKTTWFLLSVPRSGWGPNHRI